MPRDENDVFAEYLKEAEDSKKVQLQDELDRLLRRHAFAVCWQEMKEYRPDIVNDAIWRAFSNMEGFRGDAKFSTWFQSIVLHLCADEQRREQRAKQRTIPLDDLSPEQLEQLSVEDKMEAHLQFEQVEGLAEGQEKVLLDLKLHGATQKDIAKELEIPLVDNKQVAVRWSRLKQKLLQRLNKCQNQTL